MVVFEKKQEPGTKDKNYFRESRTEKREQKQRAEDRKQINIREFVANPLTEWVNSNK